MKKRQNIDQLKNSSSLFIGNEKDYFAENLAMLVSSGIGVSSAIKIMSESASGSSYKKILSKVSTDLDEGSPLWRALNGRGIFNRSYLYMVKVGEESGRLIENLEIISKQDQKNKMFHSKLISALIYPSIILSLTVLIGAGVIWFVIPKMSQIFSDLRVDLPLPTQVMINIGNYVKNYPLVILAVLVSSIFLLILFFFVPGTKRVGQAILFRTPRIKTLIKEVEIARFGYVLFSLSEAGIPLSESLKSIEKSTEISPYRKFYGYLVDSIDNGDSLEKSMKSYKRINRLFPINIQQMIIAGERSGNLIKVIRKISAIYEEKIDNTSKNLSTLLEPILLIVVWLGALFLAISIIMPIYGLIGGLGAI